MKVSNLKPVSCALIIAGLFFILTAAAPAAQNRNSGSGSLKEGPGNTIRAVRRITGMQSLSLQDKTPGQSLHPNMQDGASGQKVYPGITEAASEKIGIIESTDQGASWEFRGYADFHIPKSILPVDPSVLFDNGELIFYFFDLMSLGTDTAVAYRSVATDETGLDFTPPERAFEYAGDFTDPAVVRLQGGLYRMYMNGHGPMAIISATSSDGHIFTLDEGERTRDGGVPGALVLPDGRVRLFVCGKGITSLISDDGLTFITEPGMCIPIPPGAYIVADPDPIRIAEGTYLMAYKNRPFETESPENDEVYLARSIDGFEWTPGPSSIVIGSVPTLVELPDGRWRIYYVDFKEAEPAGLFKFVKTVQVTPDQKFFTGSFARINYVSATDRFVVTFGTKGSAKKGNTEGAGYAYKEYTTDMEETGNGATYTWNPKAGEANDSGSCMEDNFYYFVHVPTDTMLYGWRLTKFDAATWTKLAERYILLKNPFESNLDPCVAFVNGQLDISDQYNPSGIWQEGYDSHHRLFSADLDSLGYRILDDSPHISGASMIYLDGIYYLISADSYSGDLVVLKYDSLWNYLGTKHLIEQAHWSQGVACDGDHFYVSYLNTSLRDPEKFFPVHLNVHLAAFDREWNLIEDVAVTDFIPEDHKQPGRPWVIFHGNNLYVSFDVDSIDASGEELLAWQAYVSVYEVAGSTSVEHIGEQRGSTLLGFRLEQNYPNPFNSATTILFTLEERQTIKLSVYDILGHEVEVLLDEAKEPGRYAVLFDAKGLASGVYFYRLKTGSGSIVTKKLLLMK